MRRITIAAAVAVLLAGGGARAGIIVQSPFFHFASHGTDFRPYSQLSPDLAPLNAVAFESTAIGRSDDYFLDNRSASTVTFAATAFDAFSLDAGGVSFSRTFTITLPGFGGTDLSWLINNGKPIVASRLVTTDLDRFIGTGLLSFEGTIIESLRVDDPAIHVYSSGLGAVGGGFAFYDGTETITYYYGSTLGPVPEPASLISMSLGLASVAGLAWRRRRVR